MANKKIKRKEISLPVRAQLWALSAGRCAFCNVSVLDSDMSEVETHFGEFAHIVGAELESPRGESELSRDERAEVENLMLVCRNCHRPVDAGGEYERWSVEQLSEIKRDHEERIVLLTSINKENTTYIFRIIGSIRGTSPPLSIASAATAVIRSGLYPQRLPDSSRTGVVADCRALGDMNAPGEIQAAISIIDRTISKIKDAVENDSVTSVSIFGFSRIPLLIYVGAKLDDKVRMNIYQKHRDTQSWIWPQNNESPVPFNIKYISGSNTCEKVRVRLNLSGSIEDAALPSNECEISEYIIEPSDISKIGPSIISSHDTLMSFEQVMREFLSDVERKHPTARAIQVFSAVPISAAVVIGKVLFPKVSPLLEVFDRDADGIFVKMLEVSK